MVLSKILGGGSLVETVGKVIDSVHTSEEEMPLNKKGKKIKAAMEKQYGKKKGQTVFYASANKGTIKGVKKKTRKTKK